VDNPNGISNNNYYDYFPRPNPVKAAKEFENTQENHINTTAQSKLTAITIDRNIKTTGERASECIVDDKVIEHEFGPIFVH
jgi:hypothetical protein